MEESLEKVFSMRSVPWLNTRKCQTEINIRSRDPHGARIQDLLTDWSSVVTWLWLWVSWVELSWVEDSLELSWVELSLRQSWVESWGWLVRLVSEWVCSLQWEYEAGVGWSPACKDVSPEAEGRPPLPSNVTENTGLCVIVICEV
jgi:hypothetical protein